MWIDELKERLGGKVVTEEQEVERLSKDFYWYSPVLYDELKDKAADCAVLPESLDDLKAVAAFAAEQRIPLTPRGAGTGNYGQAIPLNGGIVVDLTRLDQMLAVGDDEVRVQAGARMGRLEKALREEGKELRIYPSTFVKSTVGGFICGGSGGVGSIRWGTLWDGNVREVSILTVEEEPRILKIAGEAVRDYIHSYGTAGILVEAVLPIAPKTDWVQHMVFFDSFEDAVRFGDAAARDDLIVKRLVSVCEWPIPTHFQALKNIVKKNKSIVMLEIGADSDQAVLDIAAKYNGDVGFTIPPEKYHRGLKLSDYTWNHSTLWAHKHGEKITYLQAGFDTKMIFQQMAAIRKKFGEEVQFHLEYIKTQGEIRASSLPIIQYTTKERLYDIIDFCEGIGVTINNPHTYLLGPGGRDVSMKSIIKKKKANDPYQLLNVGKISEEWIEKV